MTKLGGIFGSKKTEGDEVKTIVNKKDKAEKKDLARDKKTPVEVLEELSGDDDWEVRKEVALNKNSHVGILEKLAKDDDWRVREAVAWNEKTPVKILGQLASDRREIRYVILMNKNVSMDLVKQIRLENEREDNERKKADKTFRRIGTQYE